MNVMMTDGKQKEKRKMYLFIHVLASICLCVFLSMCMCFSVCAPLTFICAVYPKAIWLAVTEFRQIGTAV